MSTESPQEIDWDYAIGLAGSYEVYPEIEPQSSESIPERITIDPSVVLGEIRETLGFNESNLGRHIPIIGFGKGLGERFESYRDRLERERRDKGVPEAAFYGSGRIGDVPVEVFGMDFRFIGGSLSTDGGARFQQAVDTSIRENRPLIALYSSGGARQQENGRALFQLRRMVHATNKFRQESTKPHIGVLIGQVWGGISAGSAPVSDLLIALRGTDFGFSGPRVIQSYTGQEVPKEEQSVEAHSKTRLVDVLVNDSADLMNFLDRFLKISAGDHHKMSLRELGIEPRQKKKEGQVFPQIDASPQELYERYIELRSGTQRPDAESLIRGIFEDTVPLYNSYQEGGVLRYPATIASIGRIGPQPFLIIGNQPSYYTSGDELRKVPSSPEPRDYAYVRRMLKLGEKLGLPLVMLTDTLGAKPTLDAEKQGQAREIAETISAVDRYPLPVISVVSGAMGSGGGLATSIGDRTLMLEKAMLFVAEPQSSASILYSVANPSTEAVMETIKTMGATAFDQLKQGLIDEVVQEGDKQETFTYLRKAIATNYLEIQGVSHSSLLRRRDQKVRKLGEARIDEA